MKNILLATTGLFGAALLATAATAATPKVTLGGFSDFQAGFTSDDRDNLTQGTVAVTDDTSTRDVGFRNDNEISVHVDGVTDGGLGYGAVIDLEADINDDADNQGTNAARTFTYLSGKWGKVELGGNKGAAATTRVDASTLAAAFVSQSKLYTEHGSTTDLGDESTYNATKLTYYTPRFSGFQAGVSFTPDLQDRGQSNSRTDKIAGAPGVDAYGNIFEAGLNFENQFANGVKLALSLTGETGVAGNADEREDLRAYAVGGLVGYQGFSLAASYGNWDDSGQTNGLNNESDYWTVGGGYEVGPFGLSITYLKSTVEADIGNVAAGRDYENDFRNVVLGADYKLAPGLTPYAEVSFYEFDGSRSWCRWCRYRCNVRQHGYCVHSRYSGCLLVFARTPKNERAALGSPFLFVGYFYVAPAAPKLSSRPRVTRTGNHSCNYDNENKPRGCWRKPGRHPVMCSHATPLTATCKSCA
jgi:hypothetical protein